ncbi:PAS domain S-box protein [Desulfobacterales bacterium HSG17]|nr:PAS domain S-box protein [Desulfobacterales bacterium HSG17]
MKLKEHLDDLRLTLGKLEIALNSISDAIVWTDLDGNIRWCNSSFDQLIGLPRILLLGKSLPLVLPLKERGISLPNKAHPVSVCLNLKKSIDGYYKFEKNEGRLLLEINAKFVTINPSENIAIISIRDVSDKKEIEQSRIQSKALQAAANAIAITDRDGQLIWINPAFTHMTGYTLEEIFGKNMRFLKSGRNGDHLYRNLWQTIMAGHVWEEEMVNQKKNGDLYTELQTITPVLDTTGTPTHFIAIKQDISFKKRIDAELKQYRQQLERMVGERTRELKETQKELIQKAMEAGRAQLAGMILHNIGNAVTPVSVYAEKMQNRNATNLTRYLEKCYTELNLHKKEMTQFINSDERGREIFNYIGELINSLIQEDEAFSETTAKISGSISYISEILTMHQTYAAKEVENKTVSDLNRLIEDSLHMLSTSIEARGIQLRTDYHKTLPPLLIDANRCMQVIVNIIKNSYEAIEIQPDISIKKEISVQTYTQNDRICLSVTDTGIGLTSDEKNSAFNFGKSQKGSTGFGLYYCKQFVENNNGRFTIESSGPGLGATVILCFQPSVAP